jgi:NAD(P)-dependent dehydrogenase (short-subunit alcohol dehydrogenase family)
MCRRQAGRTSTVLARELSATGLGLAPAARTAGFLIAVPISGVLADRHSRRAAVLWAGLAAAVAATVQAVLPFMRQRRAGHVFAVSSMGGLMTVPGLAYYCGSKYAVEGILETVAKEVANFGVHVTIIEPGSFRHRPRARPAAVGHSARQTHQPPRHPPPTRVHGVARRHRPDRAGRAATRRLTHSPPAPPVRPIERNHMRSSAATG